MKRRIAIIIASCMTLTCVLNFDSYGASLNNLSSIKNNSNSSSTSNASNASNTSNTSNTFYTWKLNKNNENTTSSNSTSSNASITVVPDTSSRKTINDDTNKVSNTTFFQMRASNTISDVSGSNSTKGEESNSSTNLSTTTNSSSKIKKVKNSSTMDNNLSRTTEIKLNEEQMEAYKIVNKGSESVLSYQTEITLDGSLKNGTDNSFNIVQKDERVYMDKKLQTSHMSFTSSNKDGKYLEDYIYKGGSLYQFNGESYNFKGQINPEEIVGDSNYWSYIEPILKRPDLFTVSNSGQDYILTYKGNNKELYEILKKPFNIENTGGDIIMLDLQYIFNKEDGYLKTFDFRVEEDYIKFSIVGEITNINGFNDLKLPKEYSLD